MNSQYGHNEEIKTPDAFYFRVNKDWTLYYTETKTDLVVLGSLKPDSIRVRVEGDDCFQLEGQGKEKWVMCSVHPKGCPGEWKKVFAEHLKTQFEGCGFR